MASPSVIRRDKNMLLKKWLGPNRGTHWNVAGAVAVIILGGYLIYSIRDSNSSIIFLSGTSQTSAPIAPAAPTSKK